MKALYIISTVIFLFIFSSCNQNPKSATENNEEIIAAVNSNWEWGPFSKVDSANPVLLPSKVPTFDCPVRKETVFWEEKDVFNPSALIKDGKINMIYRAEDVVGAQAGTSRIGIALSTDGLNFEKLPHPVFYPDNDFMLPYEWQGGCEDPRVVESAEGKYIMTYTSWDGKVARLCLASSNDLITWEKHGLVLGNFKEGKYKDLWSKSGAIISKVKGEKIIAEKVKEKYWMYWGDTNIYLAWSEDLINWTPLEDESGNIKTIFGPREGYFDSRLVEPGPPPFITDDGIWMIYNSMNHAEKGDPAIPPGTYAAGQILFSADDPALVIARSEKNFFRPENDYEMTGQVNNVCFIEALVPYKDHWFLYYGTADSKIAVAVMSR